MRMFGILFILFRIGSLWASTELIIGGSVAIAPCYGLSEFFIGLVIPAIGSDLPELAVAIDTGIRLFQGASVSGIVTGSSISSSFGQIVGVISIASLIGYFVLPRYTIFQYGAVPLGSILILGLVRLDGQINRVDGLILLVLFLLYFFVLINNRKNTPKTSEQTETSAYQPWFRLAGGLVLFFLASNLSIDSCIRLSDFSGIPKSIISVIIIGFGTSLPELTISIGAILKKKALSPWAILSGLIFSPPHPHRSCSCYLTHSIRQRIISARSAPALYTDLNGSSLLL